MSRQMAFQMTASQWKETLERVEALGVGQLGKRPFSEFLDEKVSDDAERQRMIAAVQVANMCVKSGRPATDIRKIICWRNDEGKAHEIQIEWRLR